MDGEAPVSVSKASMAETGDNMPAQQPKFQPDPAPAPTTQEPAKAKPLSQADKDAQALAAAQAKEAANKLQTDEYVKSLEKQAEVTQGGVAAVDVNESAQKAALRRQAAQALAASRGSFAAPGGTTLARLRASSSQSGIDEGNVIAQAAKDRLAAQQAAAEADTLLREEKKKIDDAAFAAQADIGSVDRWVKNIIENNAGTFFTLESDRNRMVRDIRNRVLPQYANNPAKLQRALDWIAKIEANAPDVATEWRFETY